jgi:hypothetical protein
MKRKETFATSGSRIHVRLFGGFDYPADLHLRADALAIACAQGVPMGGELAHAPAASAATFLAQALRDPNSAPLAKIQIVKGWVADAETHERVYDVVCADGLVPDPATQRCPDSGARVDLATCKVSTDRGAAELSATWSDPEFRAEQAAFYHARVLENPSCRWSQYDANRIGRPHPSGFPATARQRAWTSPIWYEPHG